MDEIFKISRDIPRAKDLLDIAKERIDIIKVLPKDKAYKIIEEYYEIILELMTSIMYCDGFKTLSHIKIIDYIKSNYNQVGDLQIEIIDNLRKSRHGIVYYGRKTSDAFLINNEPRIRKIISILISIADDKIKCS